MGRGSASSRKSDEAAAASAAHPSHQKKAATWDFSKTGSLPPLSLHDELVNLELEVENRIQFNRLKAESHVDKVRGMVEQALIKLPNNVKNMNVREYFKKFGGNLSTFTDSESRRVDTAKRRSAAMKTISRLASANSQRKKKDTSGNTSSFDNSSSSIVPSTPSTSVAPKLGPGVLSMKVKKTPGGRGMVPYFEPDAETSGVDKSWLDEMNARLAEFRQVLENEDFR